MVCRLNQASRTQTHCPHPYHTSSCTMSSPHQASPLKHLLSQGHCQLCKSRACHLHRPGHHHSQTHCPHPGQTSPCTDSSPHQASSPVHPLLQGHCQLCKSMVCHLNQASHPQSQTQCPRPRRTSACTKISTPQASPPAHPSSQGHCQTCKSMGCHLHQASHLHIQTRCLHPRRTSPCTGSSPH